MSAASNPENDRIKRKKALSEARQKLALRKRQREELRAQRAARLGGKIDTISSYSSSTSSKPSTSSSINALNQRSSTYKKQQSLLTFIDDFDDDDDIKEDKPRSSAPNKTSLLREPRKPSTLSIARLRDYHCMPEKTVSTRDKQTDTDFDMFASYLMEIYNEEFPNESSITNEVRSNLIISKYKMGWPKELWIHEKSLSPPPQNIIYGDDDQYIEQQKKMQILREQEKQRKRRQKEMIKQRRKERLERKNRKILPEKEALLLISTGDFLENFRKKTKWIERTLGINSTQFIDYGVKRIYNEYGDDDDDNKYDDDDDDDDYDEDEDDDIIKPIKNNKNKLKHRNWLKYGNIFNIAETEGRAVCDINFNTTNSDWFISSYYTLYSDNMIESISDNDGFVLVWNLILPSFPEYKLYSESMITSTHFHPTDKFLIFAATISGQILCYDLRNGSNCKPIQRTNFSDSHSSSIYSMDFLESPVNSKSDRRHILSISNDGKLCIWKDDGLNEKAMHEGTLICDDNTNHINCIDRATTLIAANIDDNNLDNTETTTTTTITQPTTTTTATSSELTTTCFGYQYKRSDQIIFGSDSGKLYKTDIHSNANTDDEILVEQAIDAHFGPITNIDFPKYRIGGDGGMQSNIYSNISKISTSISGLYLTSSYDWTVKLWHNDYKQYIFTYNQMTDYVYDVKWCNGGKPGIFACCDGNKTLTLFDLKYNNKEPIQSIKVSGNQSINSNDTALTKLNWGNNGKYLSCGDSDGNIYLYLSHNDLLYPQQNDFDNLDKAITATISSRHLTKQTK